MQALSQASPHARMALKQVGRTEHCLARARLADDQHKFVSVLRAEAFVRVQL